MTSRYRHMLLIVLSMAVLPSSHCAVAAEIENLVPNPDFDEGGVAGWSLFTGGNSAGEMTAEKDGVVDGYAYVEVTAVGPDTWNPEVHSPSFDVDIGEVYTMAFWAKTEPGKTRSTLFKFEQLDTWVGPWEIFTLTDEWTEYHFSPTMSMAGPPAVVVHIGTHLLKEDMWLDHFRVHLGEFVEDGLSEAQPVDPAGKLAATRATLKAAR